MTGANGSPGEQLGFSPQDPQQLMQQQQQQRQYAPPSSFSAVDSAILDAQSESSDDEQHMEDELRQLMGSLPDHLLLGFEEDDYGQQQPSTDLHALLGLQDHGDGLGYEDGAAPDDSVAAAADLIQTREGAGADASPSTSPTADTDYMLLPHQPDRSEDPSLFSATQPQPQQRHPLSPPPPNEEDGPEQLDRARLQILYRAQLRKGRQLQAQVLQLQQELGSERSRMQLVQAQLGDERRQVTTDLQQTAHALQLERSRTAELQKRAEAAERQTHELQHALALAGEEATADRARLEDLHAQLRSRDGFGAGGTVARLEEELARMRLRHEQDQVQQQRELDEQRHHAEQQQQQASERQQALEAQLAASQARVRELEQAATTQFQELQTQLLAAQQRVAELQAADRSADVHQLQLSYEEQLRVLQTERELTAALKRELGELREQCRQYEASMELGVQLSDRGAGGEGGPGLASSTSSTGSSSASPSLSWGSIPPSASTAATLDMLRIELGKAVVGNREKHQQIVQLRAEVQQLLREKRAPPPPCKACIEKQDRLEQLLAAQHARDMKVYRETGINTDPAVDDSEKGRKLAALETALGALEEERDELSSLCEHLKAERGELDDQLGVLRRQLVADETAAAELELLQAKMAALERDKESEAQRLEAEAVQLRDAAVDDLRRALAEEWAEVEQQLRAELRRSEDEVCEVKERYLALAGEHEQLKKAARSGESAAEAPVEDGKTDLLLQEKLAAEVRVAELEAEREQLRTQLAEAEVARDGLERRVRALEAEKAKQEQAGVVVKEDEREQAMQRESKAEQALGELQAKIDGLHAALRKKDMLHKSAMETLRVQLRLEKDLAVRQLTRELTSAQETLADVEAEMGKARRQAARDGERMEQARAEALEELRDHYVQATSKIRADVHAYLEDAQRRTHDNILQQVMREREATTMRLNMYYMGVVKRLLASSGEHGPAQGVAEGAAATAFTPAPAGGVGTPLAASTAVKNKSFRRTPENTPHNLTIVTPTATPPEGRRASQSPRAVF